MGTVRPALPNELSLVAVRGVCQHNSQGRVGSDRPLAVMNNLGGYAKYAKYRLKGIPGRPNLKVRLVLMSGDCEGRDPPVCPFGLSGSKSVFTDRCGVLQYRDLKEDMEIEFTDVKIERRALKDCKDPLKERCDFLNEIPHYSKNVPHVFMIKVEVWDGENLISGAPLFTEKIYDPGEYGFGKLERILPEGYIDPDKEQKLALDWGYAKSKVKDKKSRIYGHFSDSNGWSQRVEVEEEDRLPGSFRVRIPQIPMPEGRQRRTISFQAVSQHGATSNTLKLSFQRTEHSSGRGSWASTNALPYNSQLDQHPTDSQICLSNGIKTSPPSDDFVERSSSMPLEEADLFEDEGNDSVPQQDCLPAVESSNEVGSFARDTERTGGGTSSHVESSSDGDEVQDGTSTPMENNVQEAGCTDGGLQYDLRVIGGKPGIFVPIDSPLQDSRLSPDPVVAQPGGTTPPISIGHEAIDSRQLSSAELGPMVPGQSGTLASGVSTGTEAGMDVSEVGSGEDSSWTPDADWGFPIVSTPPESTTNEHFGGEDNFSNDGTKFRAMSNQDQLINMPSPSCKKVFRVPRGPGDDSLFLHVAGAASRKPRKRTRPLPNDAPTRVPSKKLCNERDTYNMEAPCHSPSSLVRTSENVMNRYHEDDPYMDRHREPDKGRSTNCSGGEGFITTDFVSLKEEIERRKLLDENGNSRDSVFKNSVTSGELDYILDEYKTDEDWTLFPNCI